MPACFSAAWLPGRGLGYLQLHGQLVSVGLPGVEVQHLFEGKPLVRDYIAGTMLGIEYLWGGQVVLETFEPVKKEVAKDSDDTVKTETPRQEIGWQKVKYKMRDRQLSREEQ